MAEWWAWQETATVDSMQGCRRRTAGDCWRNGDIQIGGLYSVENDARRNWHSWKCGYDKSWRCRTGPYVWVAELVPVEWIPAVQYDRGADERSRGAAVFVSRQCSGFPPDRFLRQISASACVPASLQSTTTRRQLRDGDTRPGHTRSPTDDSHGAIAMMKIALHCRTHL